MKRSRSSLHDSMTDLDKEKQRTYFVKYAESDAQDDDPANFSTAV